jgi:hypothetical protein
MSWRTLLRQLDAPRDVKRAVYRSHRIAGLLLIAGALYTLHQLWFSPVPGALAGLFHDWGKGALSALLLQTGWYFLLAGNIAALVAGLVVAFRPSLLKGLERLADRVYGSGNSS